MLNFLTRLEEYRAAGARILYNGESGWSVEIDEENEEYGVRTSEHCKAIWWGCGDVEEMAYRELVKDIAGADIVVYIPVDRKEKLYRILDAKDVIREIEVEMKGKQ